MELVNVDPDLIRLYFLDRAKASEQRARNLLWYATWYGYGASEFAVNVIWYYLGKAESEQNIADMIRENIDAMVDSTYKSNLSRKKELTKVEGSAKKQT